MDYYKNRKQESSNGIDYSIERIDLLIVSISGAGIYVCLETLKYINDNNMTPSSLVKIGGGLFLGAIILNFISQHFGRKANEHDYNWCEYNLDIEDEKYRDRVPELREKIRYHECEAHKFSNYCVNTTNWSSIVMASGLFCLLWYFFSTF